MKTTLIRTILLLLLLLATSLALTASPNVARAQDGPSTADQVTADQAYLTALTHHNNRRADAYIAAFAPEMRCFYGKRATRSDIAELRTYSEDGKRISRAIYALPQRVEVLLDAGDTVALIDRGVSLDEDGRPSIHHKVVVLERDDSGVFLITSETSAKRTKCLGSKIHGAFSARTPDALVATCRRKLTADMLPCRSACVYASNGCEMCKQEAEEAAGDCMGVQIYP